MGSSPAILKGRGIVVMRNSVNIKSRVRFPSPTNKNILVNPCGGMVDALDLKLSTSVCGFKSHLG